MSEQGVISEEKVDRNTEIVRLHIKDRLTLKAVGDHYGITRERVRYIVRRAGISPLTTREIQRERMMRRD